MKRSRPIKRPATARAAVPSVAVLIPVVEWTYRLSEAVASVLGQSYEHVQAVVAIQPTLLDGEIEKILQSAGPRARFVVLQRDGTEGALLRAAAETVSCEYLAWLAPDDLCDPRKLEWQIAACRSAGNAVCAGPGSQDPGLRSGYDEQAHSVASPLADFLSGRLDPRALLVPRDCLDAVGGFDASYDALCGLELATRLAARFPFVRVDASLVHHRPPPREHAPVLNMPQRADPGVERERLVADLLEGVASGTFDGSGPDARREIFRQAADLIGPERPAPSPALLDRLAAIADERALAIVSAAPDVSRPDEVLAGRAHVPRAGHATIDAGRADWPGRACAAAGLTNAAYFVLAGERDREHRDWLLPQFLQAEADDLAACLPMRDPLVYEHAVAGVNGAASLIPWTLFRRSAVQAVAALGDAEEGVFWTRLNRAGRVGALPAAPLPRPVPRARIDMCDPTAMPPLRNPPADTAAHARALVDAPWYLETYPDVGVAALDPASHYIAYGWREGRNPNPWFLTDWYLARNPDVARSGLSPIEDYAATVADAARRPHPGFFPHWYAARYPAATDVTHALLHFLLIGARHGAVPDPRLDRPDVLDRLRAVPADARPGLLRDLVAELPRDPGLTWELVDADWYRRSYPDISEAGANPIGHYLSLGWREGRDPNPWFDSAWYLQQNTEARAWLASPLDHFVLSGATEGLRPSPWFDPGWYARTYVGSDVSGAAALRHFLAVGLAEAALPDAAFDRPELREQFERCAAEGRASLVHRLGEMVSEERELIASLVDAAWYASTYPDAISAPDQARGHFLAEGWRAGLNPNPWFSTDYYLTNNPEAVRLFGSPLEHFVRIGAPAGRRPHPLFDLAWYSRQHLAGSPPSAEALRHFLKIGLPAGAVPCPDIEGPTVRDWLLDHPVAERSDALQRLLFLLRQTDGTVLEWHPENAELWPVLLRRQFPKNAFGVLLLCWANSDDALIRAAEAVLPLEEYPLLCRVNGTNRIQITEHSASGVGVALELPRDAEALRGLLAAARCRRAAYAGSGLDRTSIARAVRNAELPITVNGSKRAASA